MVFIKDFLVAPPPRGRAGGGAWTLDDEEEGGTVEGTGSGFVWDSSGHIVSEHLNFVLFISFIQSHHEFQRSDVCARCLMRIVRGRMGNCFHTTRKKVPVKIDKSSGSSVVNLLHYVRTFDRPRVS